MFDRTAKLGRKAEKNLGFINNFVNELVNADETAKDIEVNTKDQIRELESIKAKATKARLYSKKLLKVLGE